MVLLPTVQLVGAQKAGTSAIADWLFDHGGFHRPHVFEGEPDYYSKEVHFFDINRRYDQGIEFYASRFVHSESSERSMDATPDTFSFADRVRVTYEAAGNDQVDKLKIIAILREPVSRELSLYNHLVYESQRLGPTEQNQWHRQVRDDADGSIMTFDKFVVERSLPALARESGPGRSTRYSLYAKHLQKWFDLFDRQQILVLSYDELKASPARLQKRVSDFLGLKISGELRRSNVNDSPHKLKSPSLASWRALHQAFNRPNEELYQLLQKNPGPSMEQKPFPKFEGGLDEMAVPKEKQRSKRMKLFHS